MGKAEILRERLIEDAERMREIDAAIDPDGGALPDTPGGAGEIAKTVDRDDDRLLEGRDVEGGGEVGEMVLDLVKFRANGLARERHDEQGEKRIAGEPVAHALAHERDAGRRADDVGELAQGVGAVVLVDGDMVDVADGEIRLAQAIGDRLGGKPGPVLDAAEAFLLGGGDERAVANERRRGVAVKRVEAKDDQRIIIAVMGAGASFGRLDGNRSWPHLT